MSEWEIERETERERGWEIERESHLEIEEEKVVERAGERPGGNEE